MRSFLLLLILTAFHSQSALACSCAEISSLGDALDSSALVVVARISSESLPKKSDSAVVAEALRVLKGSVSAGSIKLERGSFCYQSLGATELEPGAVYVLPLTAVSDGVYRQPNCSHSAAQLVGDDLYVFELSENGIDRERKLLGSYGEFLRRWGM